MSSSPIHSSPTLSIPESLSDFLSNYSNFDDLKVALEAKNINIYKDNKSGLARCKYIKDKCDMTDPIIRNFRSIIIDTATCNLVAVAPDTQELLLSEPPPISKLRLSKQPDNDCEATNVFASVTVSTVIF